MGKSCSVLNRQRRKHRGRSGDPRALKRLHFRREGGALGAVGVDAQKNPWWMQFVAARILRQWRAAKKVTS
jgi:hypothetical protein